MRKVNSLNGKWQNAVFPLTASLVVVADQLSKVWVRSTLDVGQSLYEMGFFRLTHVRNTGAAFGLFSGQSLPLAIASAVAVAILLSYAIFLHRRFPMLNNIFIRLSTALILGGTIGNLLDRLRFGYVTDFFDFGFWPAFNVADASITAGVVIFAGALVALSRTIDIKNGQST